MGIRPIGNFKFLMISYKDKDLMDAIALVMGGGKVSRFTSCSFTERPELSELVFYWGSPKEALPLPIELDAKGVFPIVQEWLLKAEYGPEPKIDGSCSKGFEISDVDTGVSFYGVFRVRPVWVHHHK